MKRSILITINIKKLNLQSTQFDEAEDFSPDGIAVVKVNGKYGFINKKGEFIIPPQFEKAEWLGGLGLTEVEGTKKYITQTNQIIWQLRQ